MFFFKFLFRTENNRERNFCLFLDERQKRNWEDNEWTFSLLVLCACDVTSPSPFYVTQKKPLLFFYRLCTVWERVQARHFFFGHFPFFFYIIPPTSYPTLPSILSLVCPLRKDKRQSLFLRRLMADDDGGSLSFSLISCRVVFLCFVTQEPLAVFFYYYYYLTTRPPKLFSFSSLPNFKNE